MEIWAHRGRLIPDLSGNTLADFQGVYDVGVHGIETDVCFTILDKYGPQQPIIYHPDPEDGSNSITKAPHLDDFLAFLKIRPNLSCFLEPKENNEKLIDVIVRKITKYELENWVYLTVCQIRVPHLGLEASTKLIFRARAQNPKIKIHLIATFPFSLSALARKYNPDVISIGWLPESKLSMWFFKTFLVKIINLKHQIRQVQNMGLKIIGGIVNDKESFEYLANLGVDGIMTDNSAAAMKFIKEKPP